MTTPLGRAWVWRGAVSGVAALVIGSASLAQQQVAATGRPSPAASVVENTRAQARPDAAPIASTTEPSTTGPSTTEPSPLAAPVAEPPATTVVPAAHLPAPLPAPLPASLPATTGLPNAEHRLLLALHRREIDAVRVEINGLERDLKVMDTSIAGLTASVATAVDAQSQLPDTGAASRDAIASAQAVYNEAIAAERRAATLAAHGVPARQELEAAQVAVRTAAATLTAARREAEMATTVASAQALEARAKAEIALAEEQQRRAAQVARLAEARRRLREAEQSLAAASQAR